MLSSLSASVRDRHFGAKAEAMLARAGAEERLGRQVYSLEDTKGELDAAQSQLLASSVTLSAIRAELAHADAHARAP